MHFGPDFSTVQPVPFTSMVTATAQIGDKPGEQTTGKRAFIGRQHRRRFACLQRAAEVLDRLPEEGESLHAVMSGYYDLMHLLIVLLQRLASPCQSMRIATLSLSRRNVQEMVALFDDEKIKRLDLLTSDFFRKHDDDIFNELVQEFSSRGQRVASARSHCKIITLASRTAGATCLRVPRISAPIAIRSNSACPVIRTCGGGTTNGLTAW